MWQRFSETSRHAIMQAEKNAFTLQSSQVDTEHLLLSLLDETSKASAHILHNFGVTADKVWPESEIVNEQNFKQYQLSLAEIEELGTHFKVDTELIRQLERKLLHKFGEQFKRPPLNLSPQVKRVLELAADEARRTQKLVKHSNYIGPEHLLLGLLRNEESSAAQILNKLGVNLEQARTAVVEHLQAKNNQ